MHIKLSKIKADVLLPLHVRVCSPWLEVRLPKALTHPKKFMEILSLVVGEEAYFSMIENLKNQLKEGDADPHPIPELYVVVRNLAEIRRWKDHWNTGYALTIPQLEMLFRYARDRKKRGTVPQDRRVDLSISYNGDTDFALRNRLFYNVTGDLSKADALVLAKQPITIHGLGSRMANRMKAELEKLSPNFAVTIKAKSQAPGVLQA